MVGKKPTDLLDGYYQLTGNPILLPKFGFYEAISMPTTATTGRSRQGPNYGIRGWKGV